MNHAQAKNNGFNYQAMAFGVLPVFVMKNANGEILEIAVKHWFFEWPFEFALDLIEAINAVADGQMVLRNLRKIKESGK